MHRWIHTPWEPSLGGFKSRLSQHTPHRKTPDKEVSCSGPLQLSQAFQSLSVQPSQSTMAVFLLLKTVFLIYMIFLCDERTPEAPDHSQPWELDAKAQRQTGVLPSGQTVTDNLALYYHKQMVISSNRMIMPNTIFNLWASPTNKSITTPSWDHYTALFPSALFAQ